MTYEIYRYIFLGGAILAAAMLVVSVIVFFRLKIPTVIGDLTGSNARKAIENIRNQTAGHSGKMSPSSRLKRKNGWTTAKISPSGNLGKDSSEFPHGALSSTEKLGARRGHTGETAKDTVVLTDSSTDSQATTVLTDSSTDSQATTVLAQAAPANETTVLNEQPLSHTFVIEYEITYIHTDEVIA